LGSRSPLGKISLTLTKNYQGQGYEYLCQGRLWKKISLTFTKNRQGQGHEY